MRILVRTRGSERVESIGDGVDSVAVGDFVVLNWRAVCGNCRACKRGRLQYCFDTFNAAQAMTLTDGTPVNFSSCHNCEHRVWADNAGRLDISDVLNRATKRKAS